MNTYHTQLEMENLKKNYSLYLSCFSQKKTDGKIHMTHTSYTEQVITVTKKKIRY